MTWVVFESTSASPLGHLCCSVSKSRPQFLLKRPNDKQKRRKKADSFSMKTGFIFRGDPVSVLP